MQEYTNDELAKLYYNIVRQDADSNNTPIYGDQRRKIARLPVNVCSVYAVRGNLRGLKTISKKTTSVLELILREGVETAREQVYEDIVLGLRCSLWLKAVQEELDHGVRTLNHIPSAAKDKEWDPSVSNEWDNAVRCAEDTA